MTSSSFSPERLSSVNVTVPVHFLQEMAHASPFVRRRLLAVRARRLRFEHAAVGSTRGK
jgi:hypothetical protein